ncbi:MAG: quinolinate synthase NadA [Proteobacteria bacterium]|jgi:quinolinate synthase|nr:quinolinate synthase NadA [Pseudomonadota bacterium]
MKRKIVTLAHYYTIPEVQQMADKVGDSLELALYAKNCDADVIVFAGVKFMAETAKIINPRAKVILPDMNSTCSLVTMTDIDSLKKWRESYSDYEHVAYINSSAQHKALSDWIVTSRNVADIIAHLYSQGKKVIYSPDRNMGAYLNFEYGYEMPLWSAVCEVHDKFNKEELVKLMNSITGEKYLISHPESPLPVLHESHFIGSTFSLLNWVVNFSGDISAVILVATEDGILYNMRTARPELDIRQAPIYNGCQCNSCPYMKLNTVASVAAAQREERGLVIDYLSDEVMAKAAIPIKRMLDFSL